LQEIKITDALSTYNSKLNMEVSSLKPAQLNALKTILGGQDVVAALPTGFGKSLIYEMIPFVNPNACVLIIEPLNVIIQQQVKKLCGMATVLQKRMDPEELEKVKRGVFPFIYSHPELLIGNPELNKVFQSDFFQTDSTYVVIDEAHCVMEWGEEFRTDYKKLSQLRAVITNAKMLALSATLSKSSQVELMKVLKMKESKVFVEKPVPDNINICIGERPSYSVGAKDSYRFVFESIFNEVKLKGNDCPLTIVYCSGSMHWIGYGYELAHGILMEDIKAENGDPRVIMYHSSVERESGEVCFLETSHIIAFFERLNFVMNSK
jgi:superfamily II DNA helicase RecQ